MQIVDWVSFNLQSTICYPTAGPDKNLLKLHRFSLIILYLLTALTVAFYLAHGWEYYRLPLSKRPHHPAHAAFKPGGVVGHGLGIIGSSLMVLMLAYSLRKRMRMMRRWGNISWWLNYHIWMGIAGPLLVILHTSFKVSGIIAISFWSMIAVAMSGVFGRYLYVQIPRGISGNELSIQELNAERHKLLNSLRDRYLVSDETLRQIEGDASASKGAGWSAVTSWVTSDLARFGEMARLKKILRTKSALADSEIKQALAIAKQYRKLARRTAFLKQAQTLLHHWHLIHKPFAVVMLLIMMVHIVVAIVFGYTWVFKA